jgi:tetratricopeptide (TPR) repeat protein
MEIFERAFNRKKSDDFKRGGRKLQDSFSLVNAGDVPAYLIHYNNAIDDLQSLNLNSALVNINKTIENSDIDDWKHFALKARIQETLKDFNEAIKNYEIAIDIAASDVTVYALYHQIALCYLYIGNNYKAIDFFTYAIDLKKNHSDIEFNRDLEEEKYGVLLGLPFKRMFNNRASAYLNIGKLDESFNDCMASISYDKTYSNPYLTLATIWSKKGHEQQALELLKISAKYGNKNAMETLNKLG